MWGKNYRLHGNFVACPGTHFSFKDSIKAGVRECLGIDRDPAPEAIHRFGRGAEDAE
jgi:hypothetical protein